MGDLENDRETSLAKREADATRREAALTGRLEAAREVLRAADQRDVDADHRDDASVKLDRDRDLAAFPRPLHDLSYGSENPSRRHAAMDRGHAKTDRASTADDREMLTEAPDTPTSEASPSGRDVSPGQVSLETDGRQVELTDPLAPRMEGRPQDRWAVRGPTTLRARRRPGPSRGAQPGRWPG